MVLFFVYVLQTATVGRKIFVGRKISEQQFLSPLQMLFSKKISDKTANNFSSYAYFKY